eukprot:2776655-Rhodomonas_salina.2
MEEHVVVSLWQSSKSLPQAGGSEMVESRLCVMGWVSLKKGCKSGKVDWCLFKQVTECIEQKLKQTCCSLLSKASIPWVDSENEDGVLDVSLHKCREAQRKGEDGVEVTADQDVEMVDLDQLLPLELEIESNSQDRDDARPATPQKWSVASQREKPRIAALFVQREGAPKEEILDLPRELQAISSELRTSTKFALETNPRPTWKEFVDVLTYSRQNNVVLVHLAGHADDFLFDFLTDESALTVEGVSPEDIAKMLCLHSTVRGGSVECVVLNACNTELLAQMLRDGGIQHVVCWYEEADDDAAMVFSKAFYASLHRNAPQGCTRIDGSLYKIAFEFGKGELLRWKTSDEALRTWGEGAQGPPEDRDFVLLLSELGDDVEYPQ